MSGVNRNFGSNAESSPPLLTAVGISKYFGHVTALENVDFDVRAGEVHAIVGDNGAGKSTLIKILSGAEQPSSGDIYLEQEEVRFPTPPAAMAAGIATVHQNLALIPTMSIAENMFLGVEITRFGLLRKSIMAQQAKQMMTSLKQMNVSDIRAECLDLSGGQRQAVAIARGVDRASRILILDEPTAALGVRESAGVISLIERLKVDGETTIILVSHNMPEVLQVADRITVLRNSTRVGTVDSAHVDQNELISMITGLTGSTGSPDSSQASLS